MYPKAAIISNTAVPGGLVIDDINKWLIIKMKRKDRRYAFVINDEAASTGLEARGSGSKRAAMESRVITHARKVNVDMILISQLKSMLDKRVQWLEDFAILCEAGFEAKNLGISPDYFDYSIYDSSLNHRADLDFTLPAAYCKQYIWPAMNTYDIPMLEALSKQFIDYYSITDSDEKAFEESMVISNPIKHEDTTHIINESIVPEAENKNMFQLFSLDKGKKINGMEREWVLL